jgi:hypothetical protein
MGRKFILHIIQFVYKRKDPYNPKKISFIIYIIHLHTLSSVNSEVFWKQRQIMLIPWATPLADFTILVYSALFGKELIFYLTYSISRAINLYLSIDKSYLWFQTVKRLATEKVKESLPSMSCIYISLDVKLETAAGNGGEWSTWLLVCSAFCKRIIIEEQSLLGCGTVSLHKRFVILRSIMEPSKYGTTHPLTQHHILQDLCLQQHCCENLKSRNLL